MFRKIQESDMVGKTVRSIDNTAANYVKITFTDDSELELYAEDSIYTQSGCIPGIFVDDPSFNEG
jgi:hypothetical protein